MNGAQWVCQSCLFSSAQQRCGDYEYAVVSGVRKASLAYDNGEEY